MTRSDAAGHWYRAYGLHIRSEIPLPELVPAPPAPIADVHVRGGTFARDDQEVEQFEGHVTFAAPGTYYLVNDAVGGVLVRDGAELIIDLAPDHDPHLTRTFIVNTALGALLHQRGLLTLHASAVALDGGAVAFIGDKGWGKSTTAAALHHHGHPLVTDDVLAVQVPETPAAEADDAQRSVQVWPGYPQLKLWPDALAALGDTPDALDRVNAALDKRIRPLHAAFPTAALPLRAVFVLGGGPELRTRRLLPRLAFMQVMRHAYTVRIWKRTGTEARHVRLISTLVDRVPVLALERPADLDRLSAIVAHVEATIRRLDVARHHPAPASPR